MTARITLAALLVTTLALGACEDDAPTQNTPGGPVVRATASNVFSPAQLAVAVGATVTWVFAAVSHDVIFDQVAGAPNNIAITANRSVERTFTTAGTFSYICSLHNGMTGAVVVE